MPPVSSLQQEFVYGDTPNPDVLRGLGRLDGRLLDVGCGSGAWAPLLRSSGARTLVALEPSPAAYALVSQRYDHAVPGTLEDTDLQALGGHPFDVLIVADVLEHVLDPWAALRTLGSWAAPGARLAVSVPNLRFFKLIGNLVLRGEFEYEPWGVRDWTHVRWYTRRSLSRMLAASGWTPETWVATNTPKGRAVARVSDTLANDFLRQQLVVISRWSGPPRT